MTRPDALRAALTDLVRKVGEMEKPINDCIVISTIHGVPYAGPTWSDEMVAARDALAHAAPTPEPAYSRAEFERDSKGETGDRLAEPLDRAALLAALADEMLNTWGVYARRGREQDAIYGFRSRLRLLTGGTDERSGT